MARGHLPQSGVRSAASARARESRDAGRGRRSNLSLQYSDSDLSPLRIRIFLTIGRNSTPGGGATALTRIGRSDSSVMASVALFHVVSGPFGPVPGCTVLSRTGTGRLVLAGFRPKVAGF